MGQILITNYMSWWDGLAPSMHVADSCGSSLEVEVLLGHFASTKHQNLTVCSPTDDGDTPLNQQYKNVYVHYYLHSNVYLSVAVVGGVDILVVDEGTCNR